MSNVYGINEIYMDTKRRDEEAVQNGMTLRDYSERFAKMSTDELLHEKAIRNPAITICWIWDALVYEIKLRRRMENIGRTVEQVA